MNYHLYQRGKDQGIFPLEELRRRHEAGELTGNEPIWAEGMGQWQPLRAVLQGPVLRANPLLAGASSRKPDSNPVVAAIVTFAIVLSLAAVAAFGVIGYRAFRMVSTLQHAGIGRGSAVNVPASEAASRAVVWTTNTPTWRDVQKVRRQFRVRQYIAGYQLRGLRDPASDLLAQQFLTNWIAGSYGGPADTNLPSVEALADRLANDPACQDPLVLTATATVCREVHESVRRLERAVKGFESSKHLGYPKFYATVTLADKLASSHPDRLPALDAQALSQLEAALSDGSVLPGDQAEIAEILDAGWGKNFFHRNTAAVCKLAQARGNAYQWLALVLKGETEINAAWEARGNGYAKTVTAAGWQGFNSHLATARKCLSRAWQLHPELPQAPCRMIYVSLGDSGIGEMRTWFDRTVAAQLDYAGAWDEMRWGLRPRWFGDYDSMLAFGVTALNTRRFDTDVPRKFFDSLGDWESEMGLPAGEHLYAREDIWPHLQELYEGYIAEPTLNAYNRDGWRSTYAVIASLAGKYEVAGEQMQALNWQPHAECLEGWYRDLSLLPQEIAARTRSELTQVNAAESEREAGDVAGALRIYRGLVAATNLDALTARFARERAAALDLEQRLQDGGWVDFLPADDRLTGWNALSGNFKRLPDGALEVRSDQYGHLLYSRARMGTEFEVRGQFEVVESSTTAFQGGLVMGIPQWGSYGWYAFRMKRNRDEGDVVSFSQHWSEGQVVKPFPLEGGTNAFDVQFHGGRLTATVNGQQVFENVRPPRGSYVSTNEFLLGLGAYNDYNSTVIRYRNVQARRL